MFSQTFIKNVSIFTSIILLGITLIVIHTYYESTQQRPAGTTVDVEQSGSTIRALLE